MAFPIPYSAAASRYESMPYRRCGHSGLKLPAISLGLWQNFGDADVFDTGRSILRYAFDHGITHFDLANNYGPPYGSAEENFGRVLATDFKSHRDELVISTKAGWDMWPGPYGDVGGSRKYLIASCDQSLKRMGLDYVDIFYSHRVDAETPLEETMGALATLHHQGKALYVGIPSYSLLNRWIEKDLLQTLGDLGVGCIAFSPLAQGMLSKKYLAGIPADSRAAKAGSFNPDLISKDNIRRINELNVIAESRGQTLTQMAIAWVLRDPRVTSALVGARTVAQLADTLTSLQKTAFSAEELHAIDRHATDGGLNIWGVSSSIEGTSS